MNSHKEYLKLFQAASSMRVACNIDGPPVEVSILSEAKGQREFGVWVSFIVISGGGLRSFFKVHFNIEDIQKLLVKSIPRTDFEISNDLAFDYMNEFCNLTAGLIQTTLQDANIMTDISVPLISYGFQDLCSRENESCFEESWILRFAGVEVKCSCFIKYYEELGIPSYTYKDINDAPQELDDIFEF